MRTAEEKRAHERAYYAKNREHVRAMKNAAHTRNKDRFNARNRAYVAKNKERFYEYQASYRFGVTRDDIQALRAKSPVCEICGNPPNVKTKRLAIDHDHITKALRGVLCTTCNLGLGAFKDNPVLLQKAFHYLVSRQKVGEVA